MIQSHRRRLVALRLHRDGWLSKEGWGVAEGSQAVQAGALVHNVHVYVNLLLSKTGFFTCTSACFRIYINSANEASEDVILHSDDGTGDGR